MGLSPGKQKSVVLGRWSDNFDINFPSWVKNQSTQVKVIKKKKFFRSSSLCFPQIQEDSLTFCNWSLL